MTKSTRPEKVLVLTNADCIRRKLDATLLRRYFAQNGCRPAEVGGAPTSSCW